MWKYLPASVPAGWTAAVREVTEQQMLLEQTAQLMTVWEELGRIGPRVKKFLPAEMVLLREKMSNLHLEGGHHKGDHGLFFRVGAILTQRDRSVTMGELSEALGVPPNTATRVVDWLVSAGYAERLPDREDRRVVRVSLTVEGDALYRAINQFVLQRTEELLRRFEPEERESLVALLQKLARLLREEAEQAG